MESDEIIIRYYCPPMPVMVDPGMSHSSYEPDILLGWICQGEHRWPVLQKFPDAEIVAKSKPDTIPKTRTKLKRIQ
ncbi:hypothetical protein ON05_035130 (plasmid) [Acaryochloris sp. CCMEE 5410]|nr:hypothetical protein ON05_035130 [Acaryochloris sp. CCMEE 5410]